jgi:hypothetical protein
MGGFDDGLNRNGSSDLFQKEVLFVKIYNPKDICNAKGNISYYMRTNLKGRVLMHKDHVDE